MSGFLLDTNLPSELTRQKPEPQVERWLNFRRRYVSLGRSKLPHHPLFPNP
jgi:hypothetical protein